jgi:hypothetical protein
MRSKVFIVCVIICHSVLSLVAQNKNDRFHIFGSERKDQINGFIGPYISVSNVEGHFTVDAGGTTGIIINNKFYIGLYGQKLLTSVPRTDLTVVGYSNFTEGEIEMKHAGGILGYIHKTPKVLNWGLSGSAGIGRIDLSAKGPINEYKDNIYEDMVILLIPKVFVDIKMTGWFRVNISGGYRLVGKVNTFYYDPPAESIPVFKASDYMKPEFSVSLLVGKFRLHQGLLQ